MPSQTSSGPFVADMRRRANLDTIWSTIKWGVLAALFIAIGYALTFLSAPEFTGDAIQWIGICLMTVTAILMILMLRADKRRLSPGSHPLDQELSVFGDPSAVARAIEGAFNGRTFAPRRCQIAGGWLCYVGKNLTIVRRLYQPSQ